MIKYQEIKMINVLNGTDEINGYLKDGWVLRGSVASSPLVYVDGSIYPAWLQQMIVREVTERYEDRYKYKKRS